MNTYQKRRDELVSSLPKNSLVLIASADEIIRNNDAMFSFRQNSDLLYLSAFNEPESIALFDTDNKKFHLFCRDKDPLREQWDGKRLGYKGASDIGADEGHDIKEFDSKFLELIKNKERIYLQKDNIHLSTKIDALVDQAKKEFGRTNYSFPEEFFSISPILHEMRLFKDEDEISIMKKACSISAQAHIRAMKSVKPGMFEYELEAEYVHEFMKNGARDCAYTPIVGSGNNSCILHYNQNDRKMENGDLVLVDAGCEYNYYASDITRTFPISGKFSAEQKAIYEVVIEAHKKSTEAIVVGNSCMNPQKTSEEVISQGLKDLGFLKEPLEEILEKKLFREFYYHKIGHWIGLDVHDDSPYTYKDEEIKFKENMIMTIEPGIYINESAPVDSKWKGIGIRIEDDILATNKGPINLTNEVPSRSDEIEQLMS